MHLASISTYSAEQCIWRIVHLTRSPLMVTRCEHQPLVQYCHTKSNINNQSKTITNLIQVKYVNILKAVNIAPFQALFKMCARNCRMLDCNMAIWETIVLVEAGVMVAVETQERQSYGNVIIIVFLNE